MSCTRLSLKFILSCVVHIWQLQHLLVAGRHNRSFRHAENSMRDISARFGVMVSFDKPVYLNGLFQGFDEWDVLNAHFGADNVTYIVRVEFELSSFKENRIRRRFRMFW